ncbi:MAG: MAPEG family protein [Nevskiaceae bacterium]|jgi:glutathione S-transferase|nr:MAPEG family protein [Nevskiaceae bacterium]
MYHLTALVTLLAVAVYTFSGIMARNARRATGVKAPATVGHPDFERAFRAQMNTLEWMPIFLPSLWLFALYISDAAAAGIGVVWIIDRLLYILGYAKAAEKRGPGFLIQALAAMVLLVGALGAVVMRLAG